MLKIADLKRLEGMSPKREAKALDSGLSRKNSKLLLQKFGKGAKRPRTRDLGLTSVLKDQKRAGSFLEINSISKFKLRAGRSRERRLDQKFSPNFSQKLQRDTMRKGTNHGNLKHKDSEKEPNIRLLKKVAMPKGIGEMKKRTSYQCRVPSQRGQCEEFRRLKHARDKKSTHSAVYANHARSIDAKNRSEHLKTFMRRFNFQESNSASKAKQQNRKRSKVKMASQRMRIRLGASQRLQNESKNGVSNELRHDVKNQTGFSSPKLASQEDHFESKPKCVTESNIFGYDQCTEPYGFQPEKSDFERNEVLVPKSENLLGSFGWGMESDENLNVSLRKNQIVLEGKVGSKSKQIRRKNMSVSDTNIDIRPLERFQKRNSQNVRWANNKSRSPTYTREGRKICSQKFVIDSKTSRQENINLSGRFKADTMKSAQSPTHMNPRKPNPQRWKENHRNKKSALRVLNKRLSKIEKSLDTHCKIRDSIESCKIAVRQIVESSKRHLDDFGNSLLSSLGTENEMLRACIKEIETQKRMTRIAASLLTLSSKGFEMVGLKKITQNLQSKLGFIKRGNEKMLKWSKVSRWSDKLGASISKMIKKSFQSGLVLIQRTQRVVKVNPSPKNVISNLNSKFFQRAKSNPKSKSKGKNSNSHKLTRLRKSMMKIYTFSNIPHLQESKHQDINIKHSKTKIRLPGMPSLQRLQDSRLNGSKASLDSRFALSPHSKFENVQTESFFNKKNLRDLNESSIFRQIKFPAVNFPFSSSNGLPSISNNSAGAVEPLKSLIKNKG